MGLTYSQVGFRVTLRAVANLLVNIPVGILVDLIGKRGLLMALTLLATGVPYFLATVGHVNFARLQRQIFTPRLSVSE